MELAVHGLSVSIDHLERMWSVSVHESIAVRCATVREQKHYLWNIRFGFVTYHTVYNGVQWIRGTVSFTIRKIIYSIKAVFYVVLRWAQIKKPATFFEIVEKSCWTIIYLCTKLKYFFENTWCVVSGRSVMKSHIASGSWNYVWNILVRIFSFTPLPTVSYRYRIIRQKQFRAENVDIKYRVSYNSN